MSDFKISLRLKTVAEMITKGNRVADIGTDHGYLPIYIVQNQISSRVIAMDVNKGPLSKAQKNIKEMLLNNYIETRLSNGLDKLEINEADTITICGMGGKLISRIISEGIKKASGVEELIVSPQSELKEFREYLNNNQFQIDTEDMLIEEGKYYVIIKCHMKERDLNIEQDISKCLKDTYFKYGRYLLENRNTVLKKFLIKEKNKYNNIRCTLKACNSDNVRERLKEIDYELECIEEGLKYYEM